MSNCFNVSYFCIKKLHLFRKINKEFANSICRCSNKEIFQLIAIYIANCKHSFDVCSAIRFEIFLRRDSLSNLLCRSSSTGVPHLRRTDHCQRQDASRSVGIRRSETGQRRNGQSPAAGRCHSARNWREDRRGNA